MRLVSLKDPISYYLAIIYDKLLHRLYIQRELAPYQVQLVSHYFRYHTPLWAISAVFIGCCQLTYILLTFTDSL